MNKINYNMGSSTTPFLVAGYPNLETTEAEIYAQSKLGIDKLVIGIAFSDPTSESTEIKKAYIEALKNPYKMDALFDLLERVQEKTQISIVLQTYYNPIFSYGNEAFAARCSSAGVSALVVLDLPKIHQGELATFTDACGTYLTSVPY